MMTKAQELRQQALELEWQHRQTIKEIMQNDTFSDSFKAQRIKQEQQKYAQALQELQSLAESVLKVRRTKVEQRLAELREQDVQRQRELLGDTVLMALWKDELSAAKPEQVVELVQGAAGEWQRTLMHKLASNEIERRMREPKVPEAVYGAQIALRGMAAEAAPEIDDLNAEARELEDIPEFVRRLDVGEERVQLAVRLGVSAEHFELQM